MSDELYYSAVEPDSGILAVDAWLISRFYPLINDRTPPPLNGLGVRHAVDLLERLGVIHLLGRDDRLARHEDLGVDAAHIRARGYEIVCEGRLDAVTKSAGIRNFERWLSSVCESSTGELDPQFVENFGNISPLPAEGHQSD